MKVVLDTNVLVSAFLWHGTAKEVFVFAEQGICSICVTQEILNELERVLAYPKFEKILARVGTTPTALIGDFMEVAAYYPSLYFDVTIISVDSADDHILACALSAGADYIISGDKHLTSLKIFHAIPILTPRQFLAVIKEQEL
jgi:putative PIN family toxin of toxin-antitoxin system